VGSIPLGYVIAVGLGFYLFLQGRTRSNFSFHAGLILLLAGLLASLSRGPWVGSIFLFLVFVATGKNPIRSLFKYGVAGLILLMLIITLPGTQKFVQLLPYFGSAEQSSISYRERLLENSLIVINRHPFIGSVDYLNTPEMESMRQGQGIIDIVNTYIQVALKSGYIGVILFTCFFLSILWGIRRRFRRLPDKNSEEHLLGRSIFATLSGILLIITVSSISVIPIVYWVVAGLGAAYINMIDRLRNDQNEINPHLA
ncbi:O-antigen ligase family protein, partial [Gammaproteobacteria bacterium]|nr:O-antigen ligase family protein [Gammaproteobacteria bacterium]